MNRKPSSISYPTLAAALLLVAGMALLAACGGKPTAYVQNYIFAYPPPAPQKIERLPVGIKVQRFEALPQFSSQRMFYIPGNYRMDHYVDRRWQGYPSDMVAGLLARDMAASHMFAAVFGPVSPQTPRFDLTGGLVQCWEDDRAGGPEAVLEVEIALLDIQQGQTIKRVLFQKRYKATQKMAAKTAESLAQAMSQAVARISPQVSLDVYQAVQQRLREGEPPLKKPMR
ncbi:ABC-type transport auxiliary lipoprotein family protein [Desulfoferula mesophila]|uniref:ABC-type transport auxiliary lipoprotein component domain-containing protein n=1 Tax=Desulfoferula mesophila TaxID=3058419 RepID=A0AAU9EU94_9BACT|nr:hypothetical protein FAK_04290 [Desulfoferula mesophilus]